MFLKTIKGFFLTLTHRELIEQLRILCALSRQNWSSNKKDIKKKHTSVESKIHVFRTLNVMWDGHIDKVNIKFTIIYVSNFSQRTIYLNTLQLENLLLHVVPYCHGLLLLTLLHLVHIVVIFMY